MEIPPELEQNLEFMEGLLGPGFPAEGAPGGEWGEESSELPQGVEGAYPDPDLLSHIDELCSQEDFLTKVDTVLHPRFLAELPSLGAQLNLLALAEELEQEEGLSLAQVSWEREGNSFGNGVLDGGFMISRGAIERRKERCMAAS
ncbi:Nut Family Member 2E [Manis pentadactyla]|nr:Nut Family Member 2E [Manis pentadactyla]